MNFDLTPKIPKIKQMFFKNKNKFNSTSVCPSFMQHFIAAITTEKQA